MKVEYKGFCSQRFFGVELEVGKEIQRSIISSVIKKYSNRKVVISGYTNSINNDKWILKTDSSCGRNVNSNGQNEGGYEITSYKASGIEDIKSIAKISSEIKKIGVKANNNCGYHIHVDVSDYTDEDMGRLIAYWLCIEDGLFASVPERRKYNNYCKKLRSKNQYSNNINISDPVSVYNIFKPKVANIRHAQEKRYSLNLLNYYVSTKKPYFKRKTVEFRFPEGTLTSNVVKNFIILLVSFVDIIKSINVMPTELCNFNLNQILQICGLDHKDDKFYIFDTDLFEARKWFLQRLKRYDHSYKRLYKTSASIMIDALMKKGIL